jgi:hypothetical protein
MLPNVLPAWTAESSGAIDFLDGVAPEEETRARRVVAHITTDAQGGNHPEDSGAARIVDGGDDPRCGRAPRRLELDLVALRTAAQRSHDAPMLEVASTLRASGEPSSLRCRSADFFNEELLTAAEARWLKRLRWACPGFFAERGLRSGQLDWFHRKKNKARSAKSRRRTRPA